MESPVATVYAEGLFNVVRRSNKERETLEELKKIREVLHGIPNAITFLRSPKVPLLKKEELMGALCDGYQLSLYTKNFCKLLLVRGRAVNMRAIVETFERFTLEVEGKVKAQVTSAYELNNEELETVRKELEIRLEKGVEIDMAVDADLLGGLVARIGDRVFDGSVKAQLEQLRTKLSQLEAE